MRTLMLVLLAGLFADAQTPPKTVETAHLIVATPPIERSAAPGARVALTVKVTPKPKMHVYSPEQPDVIPISLTLNAGDFKPHAVVLPKPEKYFFQPLNETQLVYSKPFTIVQDVTIAPAARQRAPATVTITGTLRYQACDDAVCYMPASVPVSWIIAVKP